MSPAFSRIRQTLSPLCTLTVCILSSLCASDSPCGGCLPLLYRAPFSCHLSHLSWVYSTLKVSTLELELVKALGESDHE